jgi:predicted transcriptional regulator
MKATDRTRSQLVRYALATYISTKSEPTAAVSILSEHISLRLPEGIDKEVQTYASRFDVSSSDVIRCAIDTYLNVDNKNLGQGAINHV